MSRKDFDRAALNRMYRYCYSLTNDKDAAYDLLQDGLERFVRASADLPGDSFAFLRRIIRNRYIDGLRDKGARLLEEAAQTDPDCVAIGFASLESTVIAQDELEHVWEAREPFERELLHLWALEGYSAREVAEQLDLPLGTVLARIHRLRRKLTRRDDDDRAGAGGEP